MPDIASTLDSVRSAHARLRKTLEVVRGRLDQPLTLTEKLFFGHLDDPAGQELERGEAWLMLRPDRVALQDATAQMALLQFMQAGRPEAAVPTTVHCDHLLLGRLGAEEDLKVALAENGEVYDFLRTVSAKYGLGFWKPGSGIIHQVVLENYAFPGGMMVGTDSHTPNAGGLGMAAVGVGGADAVDVMAGFPWEVLQPRILGVKLTGELSGWSAPKDVILKLLGMLTVKGGTNRVLEYFGDGCASLSATGKGTICNMGAELGATCSVFPYDERMARYLRATGRQDLADLADQNSDLLQADAKIAAQPDNFYDKVVEINLSELEPHVVGPHTPDLARPVSALRDEAGKEGWPDRISAALIGSCTNSSYEDLCRSVDVGDQALAKGATPQAKLWVSPGSDTVHATIERDGLLEQLEKVGATVLTNSCGPCIGQWQRDDMEKGSPNSIITSFNRNFRGRNDANPETLGFMASPEIVMAFAFAGKLSFDPTRDELTDGEGNPFRLQAPAPAPEVPPNGFVTRTQGYLEPPVGGSSEDIFVAEDSERLQLLSPFVPLADSAYQDAPLLLKTRGKTTTDHISPAGPWLRFRGHLDRISNNMFVGATNAFTNGIGTTRNPISGEGNVPVPEAARACQAAGRAWVVVGDENYGEGSSREHAAMCPRHLGAAAVIVRSFARIHETNLKKQGVLAFTFAEPADWENVGEQDAVSFEGLDSLAPDSNVVAIFRHPDGSEDRCSLQHTLNEEQIAWWRAGSALNTLRDPGSAV